MANRFLNNIRINDEYTFPANDGSAGQAIITDGSGNLSFGSAVASSADSTESIHISVKNTSGSQILKGTPVYVTGETGNSGKIEIAPADASDSAKMPALGILESTLNDNAEGFCVQGGLLEGLATATIDGTSTTANDTVYVKAGGGLTMTKPTGSNLIQNIAKVARVHASNGSLVVSSILRTNDVPNLTTGKIWVGDDNTTESTVVHLDETNGRMGIGTTSPTSLLHVLGSPVSTSGALITARNNNATSSNTTFGGIMFNSLPGTDYSIGKSNVNTATTLSFRNANTGVSYMDINSSGNVGIGISSGMTYPLTVQAASGNNSYIHFVNSTTGTSFSDGFQIGVPDGGSDALLFQREAANMKFYTSATERMRIDSSGNVGIGTTSPSQKLDVSGNIKMTETAATSDTDKFVVLDSGVLKYRTGSQIVSDLPTDGRYVAVAGDTMTGDLILGSNQVNFKTNGSSTSPNFFGHRSAVDLDTRFTSSEGGWSYTTFDSSSSNNPGGSLHNANGLLSFNTHSGNYGHQIAMTTNTAKLYFRTRNNSSWQSWQQVFTDAYHPNADKWTTARTITLGGDLTGSVTLDGSANVTLSAQVVNNSHTHDDRYVELTGDTMTGNLEISKSSAKLILTDSGTGQASVDVRNSSLYARWILDTDDLFRVYNQTSGFDAFAIKSSGNVGIGTTSPSYKLEVNGNAQFEDYIRITNSGGAQRILFGNQDSNGANNPSVISGANGNTYIGSGNSWTTNGGTLDYTATFLNNGNVGIGTTSPSQKLEVSGNIKMTETAATTDTDKFIVSDSGVLKYRTGSQVLSDIGAISGSGTTNYIPIFTGSKTIASSIMSQSSGVIDINGTIRYDEQIASNFTSAAKAFIAISSAGGAAKYKVYKNTNTTDGYARFKLDRAYDYGANDQMVQEAIYQRRSTTKNVRFRYEGDITTADDSYLEFYELTDGTVEGWICVDDYSKCFVEIYYDSDTSETYPNPSSSTPTGTLIHSTNPDTETPNWDSYQGDGYFSGNVGIGTTSPGAKLDVSGGDIRLSTNATYLRSKDSASAAPRVLGMNSANTFYIGPIDSYAGGGIIYGLSSNVTYHGFWGGGGEKVRITSGGNVGIGTTSPGKKLDINGDTIFRGELVIDGDSSVHSRINQTSSYLEIVGNTTDTTDGARVWIGTGQTDQGFYVNASQHFFRGLDSSTKMYISTGTGNVGIGTTSPAAKLEVNGTSLLRGLVNITTSGEMLRLNDTNSSGNPYMSFYQNGTRRSFIQHADTGDFLKLASEYGGISFFTGTGGTETQKVTIQSGGNVGIGTTSPSAMLHVSGSQDFVLIESTANSDATYRSKTTLGYYGSGTGIGSATNCWNVYDFNAGSERMRINSSGNVGIGTTSPSSKLTVVDDILLTGSSPSLTLTDATSSFVVKTNTAGEGILQTSGTSKPIRFFRNNGSNESMRIDSFGGVAINSTNAFGYYLYVSGAAAKTTGTTWVNTSDERTKENIQNYIKGLNDIVKLQPRVFDYNGKGGTEKSKENIGLIAQEVIDVYPEAIGTFKGKLNETDAKETDIYNLDFHSISISMINAIKELNEKVKILEARIQILENQ